MRLLIACFLFTSFAFGQKSYQKNYFEDGTMQSEGWLKNDIKIDYWKFYYPNGNLQKAGAYKNGITFGYWRFYAKSGNKISEGHYIKGKKQKWWLFYDKNEKINHKCQLSNNQKHGYCLMYKNEKLVFAVKYSEGKKIKKWTDFASFKRDNKLSDLK